VNESVRGLVGPSDIAEMANVSRGAVSNWRKRITDFPKAVGGTDAKPLFALSDVEAWLVARGYEIASDHGEKALWAATNAFRGLLETNDTSLLILSLCALRKSDDAGWRILIEGPDRDLWERLQILVASSKGPSDLDMIDGFESIAISESLWRQMLTAVDAVELEHLATVADSILERAARAQIKLGGESGFVGSRVSSLLSSLALVGGAPGVVYDPATGVATTLLQIAERSSAAVELFGQEINAGTAQVARQRAVLHDVELELVVGDTLRNDLFPSLRADVVVLEPPFGMRFDDPSALADPRYVFGTPPRSSSDFAWIQHCIAHLSEQGTAYVAATMTSLARSGAERDIRTAMLQQGCVAAVVALPGKMYPHTSVQLALWVLRRPNNSTSEVLLIDASEVSEPEAHVARWLTAESEDIKVPSRRVDIADLLADDAILTPQRWLDSPEQSPDEIAASYASNIASISEATATMNSSLASLGSPTRGTQSRLVTVAELVAQGVVSWVAGRAKAGDDEDDQTPLIARETGLVVTPRIVRSRVLPVSPSGSMSDGAQSDVTSPGDVLVVTLNHIEAIVDTQGGLVVGQGVSRLRVTNSDVLLPEYLAALLMGSWNNRFLSGAAMQRAHVKELEVPLVPISEQRELAVVFSRARTIADSARLLAEESAQIENTLRDAVRYGVALGESSPSEVSGSRQTEGDPSGASN